MAENNVGLTLKYSNKQVADAMESIGYTPYNVSPEDLQKLTAIAEQLNDWQRKAVEAMNDGRGFLSALEEANIMLQADEIPFHEFDDSYSTFNDDEQVGYYMFNNGLGPEGLQAAYDAGYGDYLDIEQYVYNMRCIGCLTVTTYGFLFDDDDMPDTDRYSAEEIDEWIRDNA